MNFDDFYEVAKFMRFLGTIRGMILGAVAIAALGVGIIFWNHSNLILQTISFVFFLAVGSLAAFVFLKSPVSWISYIFMLLFSISLALFRLSLIASKYVLIGILYLVYLVSPIDLIPGDFITVIGLLDDLIIGGFFVAWIYNSGIRLPEIDTHLSGSEPKWRLFGSVLLTGSILIALKAM